MSAFNVPLVGCCGRDAADCDCPPAQVANAAATFLPGGPDGVPTVNVAGVMVLVYVDPAGRLVISANFDDSELGDPTPVMVRMNGERVWAA